MLHLRELQVLHCAHVVEREREREREREVVGKQAYH